MSSLFLFIVLIGIPLLFGFYAQMRVSSTYNKWLRVGSRSGISGREAAAYVLQSAGIDDVQIVSTGGKLTDHYDPVNKRLVLSEANYHGNSLAALGVAAHEAGHAIQHQVNYSMLNARMALVPITGFASQAISILFIASFFIPFLMYNALGLKIAVACYLILTIFHAITLPVEFDASKRAKEQLMGLGIINAEEKKGVAATLDAAAWTYVAAFVASLGTLLYYVIAMMNRR